jgi:hypothetical protein
MDRLISLGIGTVGAEDYFSTFQDMSELARNLGESHNYVNLSAQVVDGEPEPDGKLEEVFYDENTLFKAHAAIQGAGFSEKTAFDIINALQNAGILLRERPRGAGGDR